MTSIGVGRWGEFAPDAMKTVRLPSSLFRAFRRSFADGRPVMGDRVQLQQVLLNLIMNGVEAMKEVTERAGANDNLSSR